LRFQDKARVICNLGIHDNDLENLGACPIQFSDLGIADDQIAPFSRNPPILPVMKPSEEPRA
jgi:hypothetical protein